MERITSFTVDHTKLIEGIYVSRVDGDVTTYDLRFKKPNKGDYLSVPEMHTTEHLLLPMCATPKSVHRLYILVLWDVARDFTC